MVALTLCHLHCALPLNRWREERFLNCEITSAILRSSNGSKLTGNPGKICWRITLWYRVIGGIATELAIAYSLHTAGRLCRSRKPIGAGTITLVARSEEHTSELQSLTNLVCRLLLEKKTPRAGFS